VRSARRTADVVVVYLHWGTDYTGCPNPLQRRTARALARAGADVVVGTHAHRVQGAGWLGRTYVGYGLGNFVWWRRNNELESRSGVLTLTVRGRRVVGERWTPMRVSKDGIPRVSSRQESARLQRAWQRSRGCTGLASAPS
jgi:poly-gamma-glutamate synthesis protein (capsule biosynthesis protein)